MTRISSISKKLVKPVEFSNGKAELTLKKPPPLVPSSLITSCEATGPWAERLGAAGEGVDHGGVAEVLDHSLGDEEEGADDRDRQQDVEQDPDQVLPEVADLAAGPGDDAADQGDDDGDPDRGRDEVLHRQAGHLGEVGERRFAAVVLPVGVGDEGGGRVEAEVPRRRSGSLRD